MNKADLIDYLIYYYINVSIDFYGECGHHKLLSGLKKFIKPIKDKKVIGIDVGACIGNYLPHFKEICNEENKDLLFFEPNPLNLQELNLLVNNEKNCKVYPYAVSNVTETSSLYSYEKDKDNYVDNQCSGLRSGGKKICDIDVVRLEDILEYEYGDEDIVIKYIKIDTEGNDKNVLKGLGKYLQKTKCVIFDCSDCLSDVRGPGIENPVKDIVDYLSSQGFDTYRIGKTKLIKINDEFWNKIYEEKLFWSNCFCIKKDDELIHDLIDEEFNYKF